MSKIKKKVFGIAIAVGFMAFNFVASNSTGSDEYSSSFTLKNLSALQASAGEWYCNPINENACFTTYNGEVFISKGMLIYR